ncbi:hypothetical protein [Nocardia sp. NRRL S-836]|nr:hypothetical protein [Nocardia sp. NRRL S-836]
MSLSAAVLSLPCPTWLPRTAAPLPAAVCEPTAWRLYDLRCGRG